MKLTIVKSQNNNPVLHIVGTPVYGAKHVASHIFYDRSLIFEARSLIELHYPISNVNQALTDFDNRCTEEIVRICEKICIGHVPTAVWAMHTVPSSILRPIAVEYLHWIEGEYDPDTGRMEGEDWKKVWECVDDNMEEYTDVKGLWDYLVRVAF